uniref:Uncharacterized protein n=1 Tax=Knipowitschia caucasica TaxID=637954 RepID=A0AAV2JDV1_KNICA
MEVFLVVRGHSLPRGSQSDMPLPPNVNPVNIMDSGMDRLGTDPRHGPTARTHGTDPRHRPSAQTLDTDPQQRPSPFPNHKGVI